MVGQATGAMRADFFVERRDVSREPEAQDIARLDALLDSLDLVPLGAGWQPIELEQAPLLLEQLLDSPYTSGIRGDSGASAKRSLDIFLSSFDVRRVRAYSNLQAGRGADASTWTPFTRGGRCVCVACCDDLQAGMLWIDR